MNEYTVNVIARLIEQDNQAIIQSIGYVRAGTMDWNELSEVIQNEILEYEEANA